MNFSNIVEVDVDELEFDEAIEGIFGAVNGSDHPDLTESFTQEGSLGTLPMFREVDGKKKCFSHRKFVGYCKDNGIKKILAQRVDGDDAETQMRSIKTNTNKHSTELIRAKMVKHLYDQLTLGKGSRTDLKRASEGDPAGESDESNISDAGEGISGGSGKDLTKPKRNPTVYDKIGPILGISPKKAQMLKVILDKVPAYFDRMERERTSVYEAYSKVRDEEEGYTPSAPREKTEVDTTDTTGLPKFLPGDSTYDVNAVYKFIENKTDEGHDVSGGGKKKMVIKTTTIYVSQSFTCTHCGEVSNIVVPKTATDEQ